MVSTDQRLLDIVLEERRRNHADHLSPAEFFDLFAAQQTLINRDLTIDQLFDGIVDGANDCGVDGIWIFIDGRYVTGEPQEHLTGKRPTIDVEILQAKAVNGFAESTIEKLAMHLPHLLGTAGSGVALRAEAINEKLAARSSRFKQVLERLAAKFPQIRVNINYVTKADVDPHPNVVHKADLLRVQLQTSMTDLACHIKFIGASRLRELAGRAEDSSYELRSSGSPMSTERGNAYVCLVSLANYRAFLSSDSGALRMELFESNVRDYAGRTPVNDAIRQTLLEPTGDDFWCFNNGVTILAEQCSYMSQRLVLKNPNRQRASDEYRDLQSR